MPVDAPESPAFQARVEALRRFNRLYTRRIGLLQSNHLDSGFSLTEARLLYELSQRVTITASTLCESLSLDQGYVSRILKRFQKQGLIQRRASPADGRVQSIGLTAKGKKLYAGLDAKAHASVAALLRGKPEGEQRLLAEAAGTLERLLGAGVPEAAPLLIRPPQPGDLGWIVHRHGAAIAKEFGWDTRFEAVIAEILGQYGRHPGREQGWVAERGGTILGSVFLMPEDESTARLRVLYVEPAARGLGLGKKLVDLCIAFARQAGYARIVLWTHEFQKAARNIYQGAGFRLVEQAESNSFGVPAVSETWELDLKPQSR